MSPSALRTRAKSCRFDPVAMSGEGLGHLIPELAGRSLCVSVKDDEISARAPSAPQGDQPETASDSYSPEWLSMTNLVHRLAESIRGSHPTIAR